MSKTFRSVLATLLVCCLLVGLSGNVLAVTAEGAVSTLTSAFDTAVEKINSELDTLKSLVKKLQNVDGTAADNLLSCIELLRTAVNDVEGTVDKVVSLGKEYTDKATVEAALKKLDAAATKLIDAVDILDCSCVECLKANVTCQDVKNVVVKVAAVAAEAINFNALANKALDVAEIVVEKHYDSINALAAYIVDHADEAWAVITSHTGEEWVELLLEKVSAIVESATHADYTITADSHYVAIGDNTAYVELLSAALTELADTECLDYTFTNLAQDGTIHDAAAVIAANESVIAGADLITVGYDTTIFAEIAIDEMVNALSGIEADREHDWADLVGETAAEYMVKAVEKVNTMLIELGLDYTYDDSGVTIAEAMTLGVESYTYNLITYALEVRSSVNTLQELNPDALIAVVGMSNAFAGVTVEIKCCTVNLGALVETLVHAANVCGVSLAYVNENVVYVPASAAESDITGQTITLNKAYIYDYLSGKVSFETTEAGNEYIAAEIMNALNITVEGILGDVNCDGIVDCEDASLIMQYEVELITADQLHLEVADVNGDGVYDSEDASLICQYEVGLITAFPVEG